MKIPSATYRLQFSSGFTFEQLDEIIDYLDGFGISTIYASPFFQARKGSTHGYDIVNPLKINKEIGDLETFRKISQKLQKRKISWLQDIVPNHMAFDASNIWLTDIFELGEASEYYQFFDINWAESGKVIAPFLGDELEKIIEKKELKLVYNNGSFFLKYFDHSYPLSAKTYSYFFHDAGEEKWKAKAYRSQKNASTWKEFQDKLASTSKPGSELFGKIEAFIKKSSEPEELKKVLDLQYFLPTYWKTTEKKINYRRFFTINDLICLRMEDPRVFEVYHRFIAQLCREGLISGLRIDHIDGLFDPAGYLKKLKALLGNDFYVVVEKILEWEEHLPDNWESEGTSGYSFLATVNNLLTDEQNEQKFLDAYAQIEPQFEDYEELVFRKKQFILLERMGGELQNLLKMLQDLSPQQQKRDFKPALSAFLAAFPVYRIYPESFPLSKPDKTIIEAAYQKAKSIEPSAKKELEFLRYVFLGEAELDKDKMLYFLKRCQQFSGPLAAKGVEDTTFYLYNNLISHNEVGDSPHVFGINTARFHREMKERQEKFPFAVNATGTHDTKRGEDARMRINVLSEIPDEWFSKVKEWQKINERYRVKGIPTRNEEYFIYQTLVGAKPFEEDLPEDFLPRTQEYLQKVLREAKQHSNWSAPNEDYEKRVLEFTAQILSDKEFMNSLNAFVHKTSFWGMLKSLSHTLLKITAPGVPDVYQGSELWDFSYVDPDNRRPVDYEKRKVFLKDFQSFSEGNTAYNLKAMLENYRSGKIKMYTLYKALAERKKYREVFEKGEYIPVTLSGKDSEKMLSFIRKDNHTWFLVLVPVNSSGLFEKENFSIDENLKNCFVNMPESFPENWENVLTGENYRFKKKNQVFDLLNNFPVVLLKASIS